ncbi:hypothetical protein GGF32_009709 [Allomyces javanicus]|nr:hypothetical protein GGF32_009709 [Allomyces javanicus]
MRSAPARSTVKRLRNDDDPAASAPTPRSRKAVLDALAEIKNRYVVAVGGSHLEDLLEKLARVMEQA